MSLRLSAALCGAALMFCCPHLVSAKLASNGPSTKQCSSAKRTPQRSSSGRISQGRGGGAARIKSSRNTVYGVIKSDPSAEATVTGKASTYNPLRPEDSSAGGLQTASGENYNPEDWTAAIQTALRGLFKGINFGKAYKPAFALVESNKKSAIVRINDVGPLKPGRIIDLNERAMRYFDPSLKQGILPVKVTPLVGYQTPGPTAG